MSPSDDAAIDVDQHADAGERTLVIEPDDRELFRLRANLERWLASSALPRAAKDDIVLVASELIAKVLVVGSGNDPIEVRCRYTHSLAVIEVAQPSSHRAESRDLEEALAADIVASEILSSLTSRLTITGAPPPSVIRCSLSLSP